LTDGIVLHINSLLELPARSWDLLSTRVEALYVRMNDLQGGPSTHLNTFITMLDESVSSCGRPSVAAIEQQCGPWSLTMRLQDEEAKDQGMAKTSNSALLYQILHEKSNTVASFSIMYSGSVN
jgi:hypothetical protein